MMLKLVRIASVTCFVLVLLLPGSGLDSQAVNDEEGEPPPALGNGSQYAIDEAVIGAAGSPGSSASYASNGTLGQPTPIGAGTAGGKTLRAGFWGQGGPVTGAGEIPPAFRLSQNYPNPFNPVTTIEYALPRRCRVDVAIYDVGGRRIRRLVHGERAPGRHRDIWDGTDERGGRVATGVYFYRLKAGSFVSVKKMVLLK
jgi:hypothetical protein